MDCGIAILSKSAGFLACSIVQVMLDGACPKQTHFKLCVRATSGYILLPLTGVARDARSTSGVCTRRYAAALIYAFMTCTYIA